MIILIFTVIIILSLIYFSRRDFVPEDGHRVSSIGNFLSKLFYDVGRTWSRGETYYWNDKSITKNDFFLNLPSEYPMQPDIPNYIQHHDDGYSAWSVDTDEAKHFWDAMKPHVHSILNDALEKSGLVVDQKNPVIHFRCSDVPFNKHTWYHLAKWDFYKRSVSGYDEVDVLLCTHHGSHIADRVACEKYVELLEKELAPVKVNVLCGHFIEDFARMFYAPLVVSPGSSMSFMAGYFGHGKLVTTGHFIEGSDNTCKICEGDRSDVVLHSEIPDYHDVDYVNKMLKGNR